MGYFLEGIANQKERLRQGKESNNKLWYNVELYCYYRTEALGGVLAVILSVYISSLYLGLMMGHEWYSLIPFYTMIKAGFTYDGTSIFSALVSYVIVGHITFIVLYFLIVYRFYGIPILMVVSMLGWLIPLGIIGILGDYWGYFCDYLRKTVAFLQTYAPWFLQGVITETSWNEQGVLLYFCGVGLLLRYVYTIVQFIRYYYIFKEEFKEGE